MADRCRHIGSSSPLLCPRPQGEGVPWGFSIYLPQLTQKPRYRRFHIWWHAILTTSFSLISGGKPCQEHYNTNTNSPTAPEYQRLLPRDASCRSTSSSPSTSSHRYHILFWSTSTHTMSALLPRADHCCLLYSSDEVTEDIFSHYTPIPREFSLPQQHWLMKSSFNSTSISPHYYVPFIRQINIWHSNFVFSLGCYCLPNISLKCESIQLLTYSVVPVYIIHVYFYEIITLLFLPLLTVCLLVIISLLLDSSLIFCACIHVFYLDYHYYFYTCHNNQSLVRSNP